MAKRRRRRTRRKRRSACLSWEETCERAGGEGRGGGGLTVENSGHATCGHAAGSWMAS